MVFLYCCRTRPRATSGSSTTRRCWRESALRSCKVRCLPPAAAFPPCRHLLLSPTGVHLVLRVLVRWLTNDGCGHGAWGARAAASEAARKKLDNKLEKAKKELDKWVSLSTPPQGRGTGREAQGTTARHTQPDSQTEKEI